MPTLPEPAPKRAPVLQPGVVRDAVSPTAVALVAAGAGIGGLDHSAVLAIALAVGAWALRVSGGAAWRRRRYRGTRPRPAVLDPWRVPEPWRQLVVQALDAQTRFDRAVTTWPAGPLRLRLESLQPRLWDEIREVGRMAERGAAIDPATSPTRRPSAEQLAQQLHQVEQERRRLDPGAAGQAGLARSEAAIAAQIESRHRADQAAAEVLDRVRVAVAALERMVTEVLAIDTGAGRVAPLGTTGDPMQRLGLEIEVIRAALTEAAGAPDGHPG